MTRMRLCPTVEGSAAPLITHMIPVDVCMARQRALYHKCHRCAFRGKAANWEPAVGSTPPVPGSRPTGPKATLASAP